MHLGIPAIIIANDCRDIGVCSDRGVDFTKIETGGSIAHDQKNFGFRAGNAGANRISNAAANRARWPVDHAARGNAASLYPLTEFAAIGDKNW